jgi:adenylylsulfate kinase
LTVVGLFDVLRKINKKKFKNYVEIFIQTDLKKIIKFNKKKLYKNKIGNVMGLNIKAEFPKNPNIIIKNNFDSTIKELSEKIIKKISNKYCI